LKVPVTSVAFTVTSTEVLPLRVAKLAAVAVAPFTVNVNAFLVVSFNASTKLAAESAVTVAFTAAPVASAILFTF